MFLLNTFLEFKKRQNGMYRLIRNESLYSKLFKLESNMSLNVNDIFFRELRKSILSHNLKQFSSILETLTLSEKYYILNEENKLKIKQLLDENDWSKGSKLFKLVVNRLEKKS